MSYKCDKCNKVFGSKLGFDRHNRYLHKLNPDGSAYSGSSPWMARRANGTDKRSVNTNKAGVPVTETSRTIQQLREALAQERRQRLAVQASLMALLQASLPE